MLAGGVGVSPVIQHFRSSATAPPTNSVVPAITGDPVVGQTLFSSTGTWSNSPTNYSYQWYNGSGAISGEIGDTYLIQDADVGLTFSCKVVAVNGAGSSAQAASAATSAVTAISLTNAITALTRTSASGVTPMTWNLTLAANVYEGYTLHARVYSDSGLTTLTQDVTHFITGPDMVASATIDLTSDGLTAPTATQWLQLTVETTSPNGIFYSYTYPTPISPTDASVAMTWSATDKSSGITLSGGNLTASQASAPGGLRASRGIGSGNKVYWEIMGNFEGFGAADSSAVLTTVWGGAGGDGSATIDAVSYQAGNGFIFFNGTGTAAAGYTTATTWAVALDTTASPYTAAFYKANVLQATISLTGIGATLYPAAQINNGQSTTLNPGTTPGGTAGFTYTPPTGFVAP